MFGIFGHPDAAAITALGLHALQHRGQEAAGIVTFDGQRFHSERRLGLVGDTFSDPGIIAQLAGDIGHRPRALFHHRRDHPAQRPAAVRRARRRRLRRRPQRQPHQRADAAPPARQRRRHLPVDHRHRGDPAPRRPLPSAAASSTASSRRLRQIEGAYAFVGLTNKKLIGARDPLGIRPLVLGMLDGHPILASETCALDIIGARFVRDVENGEVIVISDDGIESLKPFPPMPPRPCIFEYIYFARPDSIVGGRPVYEVRKRIGARAGPRDAPVEADVVVPVPDSGVPAAIGYAQQAGIPFELGIIRNHYVGRTFIQPTQTIRELGVRLKHSANRAVVAGKRIVLVDDSHRARHHLGEDRADDARRRRPRGALPHRLARRSPIPTITASTRPSATSCSPPTTTSTRCAAISAPTRWPSCRSTASTAPWASGDARPVAAAVHRPLLHRRLPDRADRPQRRGAAAAPALAAGGGELRAGRQEERMPEGVRDVKEAVRVAANYLRSLKDFIPVVGLRLEETEFTEDGDWLITLSTIDVPSEDIPLSATDHIRAAAALDRGKRIYKVIQVDAMSGEVRSMKVRSLLPIE